MQASADDVNNDDDEQSIVLTRQVHYELGPGNIVNKGPLLVVRGNFAGFFLRPLTTPG